MLLDKSKFAMEHGVKASTVSGWMQRHWTKGLQYYVIGRTTMIDTEEFERWIRNSQQESDLVEMVLKSKSGSTVSPFTKRSSSVIHTARLTLDA
jgi:hypothetical protein